jgi:hypothetical protein
MSKKNIGSDFDDFLSENALLDEATAVAVKRVIAWQIEQEMKAQNLNKTTLASVAAVLGKKLKVELLAA